MTGSNGVQLLAACFAGMALGGIFYGGLWLTIRHTLSSAALGPWLMCSFIARTFIALAGFYGVFAADWGRLMACLVGFVLARFILARVLRLQDPIKVAAGVEVLRAP